MHIKIDIQQVLLFIKCDKDMIGYSTLWYFYHRFVLLLKRSCDRRGYSLYFFYVHVIKKRKINHLVLNFLSMRNNIPKESNTFFLLILALLGLALENLTLLYRLVFLSYYKKFG